MIIFLLNTMLSVAAAEPSADIEGLFISSSLTLKVQKREQTIDALIAHAEEAGGYYSSRTDSYLRLKLPAAAAESYLLFAEEQGLVSQKQFNSQSLQRELANLEAKLKTREELLTKYFAILESSGADNVMAVESEVIRLVSEIENLKGQLRKREHQTKYADLEIYFQFRDRSAPVAQGDSSFGWINSLNLVDLLSDFRYTTSCGSSKTDEQPVPEGFAAYDVKIDRMSASSDGLIYRVRTDKPDPQASGSFWAEAVSRRMEEAGYFSYEAAEEGEAEAVALQAEELGAGYLLKLAAPNGNEDFAYWIAFKVDGKKLLIIEAAGEAAGFQEAEERILAAMTETLN